MTVTYVDENKRVFELTPEEKMFLGDEARNKLNSDNTNNKDFVNPYQPYKPVPYPKWIVEKGGVVNSEEEEEAFYKEYNKNKEADIKNLEESIFLEKKAREEAKSKSDEENKKDKKIGKLW